MKQPVTREEFDLLKAQQEHTKKAMEALDEILRDVRDIMNKQYAQIVEAITRRKDQPTHEERMNDLPPSSECKTQPCGEGCSRCCGEYCDTHFDKPCECDIIDRHRRQA